MFLEENKKSSEKFDTHFISSPPSYDHDLRYIPRWEVKSRVMYIRPGEIAFHQSESHDINCMGACIFTDEEIPLDEKLNVTIYLTSDISISVTAKVVWEKTVGEQKILGLHFENVSDQVRDLIFNYAFEYKKEDLVKNWFKGF